MKIKGNLYSLFIHIMLVVLLVFIVILAKQNNELKNAVPKTNFDLLKEGDEVPDLKAQSLDGIEIKMALHNDTSKTILFIMSTECGQCKSSIPNWNLLTSQFNSDFRIFGILSDNLDEIKDYKISENIQFEILRFSSVDVRKKLRVLFVPLTVLISQNRIEKIWSGEFNNDALSNVLNHLSK